jgi:hypothetical protein
MAQPQIQCEVGFTGHASFNGFVLRGKVHAYVSVASLAPLRAGWDTLRHWTEAVGLAAGVNIELSNRGPRRSLRD